MTGLKHQYIRQHSSTTGCSNKDKISGSKFRRCSSVDDQNSIELLCDDKLFLKREYATSDADSGTEEIEQLEQHFIAKCIDNDDIISVKSFGPNPDEGFSEYEVQDDSKLPIIEDDLSLSKIIPDYTKKEFCPDTSVAFHGEFARLISIPLSLYYGVRYYLFAEEELINENSLNLQYIFQKLDNAKAQFKCPNIACQHGWTSMRARIIFSIGDPNNGIIVLKIFGQNCQHCGTYTEALWYIDEVCRVMKNLAKSIFEAYFPDMINKVDLEYDNSLQDNIKPSRHPIHDPTQRKGKMLARHAKEYCEACRYGLCFPDSI